MLDKKMKWIAAIATSLVLNLVLTVGGRGNFVTTFLPVVASLWIGLPLLVLSVVLYFIATRKHRLRALNLSRWGIAIAMVTFTTVLSIPAGKRILASDMNKAQQFCNALASSLEDTRSQTGKYPHDIYGLLAGRRPPRLIRSGFYQSDGTNYSFIIVDPGEMMGGIGYSSQTKSWSNWD